MIPVDLTDSKSVLSASKKTEALQAAAIEAGFRVTVFQSSFASVDWEDEAPKDEAGKKQAAE